MERNKLPHDIEVNELLKLLDNLQPEDKAKPSQFNPVLSFLQAFNITHGNEPIRDVLLYRLFKLWSPDSLIDKTNFIKQLNLYIERKAPQSRFYLINASVIKISEDLISLAEQKRRDKTKSKHFNNHFLRFLDNTKLSEGKHFVEGDILYYVYNNWWDKARTKTFLGINQFLLFCDLHFTKKRLSNSKLYWYGVSDAIYQLIDEQSVLNWREGRKRKYAKEGYQKPYKKYRKKTIYSQG